MTTISLSRGTQARLAALGRKGETYEQILIKLLDLWEKEMAPPYKAYEKGFKEGQEQARETEPERTEPPGIFRR